MPSGQPTTEPKLRFGRRGKSPPTKNLRWLVPLAIGTIGALSLWAVHAGLVCFTGKPSRDVLILIGLTEISLYVWIRLYSGLSLVRQGVVICSIVALQAGLYAAVRLDGFAGDGRPVWTWRWNPTPEEVFRRSRAGQLLEVPPDQAAVDLRSTSSADWPAFRGRDRTGQVPTSEWKTDWQRFPPRRLWRQPVGAGWSSFAVVGDYCVTQEQRGDFEATVCYEVLTGREAWAHLDRARFDEPTGGIGPRATPTIDNGSVFAVGATGILNCLDGATGNCLWTVDILADNGAANCLFGVAGSPLVVDRLVIVCPGGAGSSVAAYDRDTGQAVWKGGSAPAAYSSPQFALLNGRRQVLNFNAEGLFAHDLDSESDAGQVLWSFPWVSNPAERNNVGQPVVIPADSGGAASRVLISSGYGRGTALLEIGSAENPFPVRTVWTSPQLQAKFSSVVLHEGYVYGLDGAILTCLDVRDGRRCWKGGRCGFGQLILVGSMLLVQLESGEIALVEASPREHRELCRFEALSGRTWNHPAIAGRRLLVRNDREAACYEFSSAVLSK